MIFFSSVVGMPLEDARHQRVGTVKDAMIMIGKGGDFPPVVAIIAECHGRGRCTIAVEEIEQWGPVAFILKHDIEHTCRTEPQEPDLVSLEVSVLDKQIVDLAGLRIVRVNDLQLGHVRGKLRVIALDISTRGLLRRLGLHSPMLDRIWKSNVLEWKNVRLMDNTVRLSTGIKDIVKLHPADIANIIEKMNVHQGSMMLQSLDAGTAARVLEEIQPDIKTLMVKSLGPERAATLLDKMSVDELVDLIQLLPSREAREIIARLPSNTKLQKMKKILEYDEDTAGGLMTTEYVTAKPESTVAEVVQLIKDVSSEHRSIHFVYITDSQGTFVGVVSPRKILISDPQQKMSDILKPAANLPAVNVSENLVAVARLMTKYNLFVVAVLDGQKLIGIVTADDIMRRLVPNA